MPKTAEAGDLSRIFVQFNTPVGLTGVQLERRRPGSEAGLHFVRQSKAGRHRSTLPRDWQDLRRARRLREPDSKSAMDLPVVRSGYY